MFCTKCGNKLGDESSFCTSCGQKVESAVTMIETGEKKFSWKRVAGGIVAALVFIVAFGAAKFGAQEAVLDNTNKEGETSIEQALVEASNETNKQLPMMVDSSTQLSTTLAVGKDFVYSYKVIGADYISLTQADLTSAVGADITKAACTTPETKQMLDMGVRLVYRYSNEQGKYLGEIPVTLSGCN